MSDYLDALIFDRVQADIDELTSKAYISNNDLNRIETAIKYVAIVLNKKGYRCTVNNKMNWKPRDERTASEMGRIRTNIETLRNTYYAPDSTPVTPSEITYTSIWQANAIERIIYDIGQLIEAAYPAHQRLAFKFGTKAFGERIGGF